MMEDFKNENFLLIHALSFWEWTEKRAIFVVKNETNPVLCPGVQNCADVIFFLDSLSFSRIFKLWMRQWTKHGNHILNPAYE